MTTQESLSPCAICGGPGILTIAPPRRTLARGSDSGDHSLSVIALLPDVVLCDEHAEDLAQRELKLGWCDDEHCRSYGEAGQDSPCGQPFKELRH